jgi:hypothetical protein
MGAGLPLMLSVGTALASVPTSDELAIRFKVLKSGPTSTVEIRISPRSDFDSVAVEAASGVASMTPPCAFTKGKVTAGESYVCRMELAGKPSDAAMTINVIARRTVPGGLLPVLEVHHLSVKNSAFARSQKSAAASHHDVATGAATPK